jgi:hypothetical protein
VGHFYDHFCVYVDVTSAVRRYRVVSG